MYSRPGSPCTPIGNVPAAPSGCFHLDLRKARAAYHNQKSGARARGIEFKLTFDEWLEFWGRDIEHRGKHRHQLCMQRPCDKGAYELGNIRKGTPKENGVTKGAMYQARAWDAARWAYLEAVEPSPDDETPDDRPAYNPLGYVTSASCWDRNESKRRYEPDA